MAFVILFGLLSWFIISARGKWFIKAAAMAVAIYSSILIWTALDTYRGWPTRDVLPAKMLLHWVIIEEPNKKTGDEGSFYLWIVEMKKRDDSVNTVGNPLEYVPIDYEPRSYRLPYDPNNKNHREMHKALQGFKNEIVKNKGKPIAIEATKGKNGKGEGEGKDKDGGKDKGKDSGVPDFSTPDFQFHKLSPGKYPEKVK